MARPLRKLSVAKRYARRRHRTWMLSMTLASLGWGCWWVALFSVKLLGVQPDLRWVGAAAALFAIPGILVAIFTLRAQASWLFFVSVPLMANAGLLLLPLVVPADLFVR